MKNLLTRQFSPFPSRLSELHTEKRIGSFCLPFELICDEIASLCQRKKLISNVNILCGVSQTVKLQFENAESCCQG